MGIKYYPNRVFKGVVPAIDRVMAQRRMQTPVSKTQDITAVAIDDVLSSDDDWRVNSIAFEFSGPVARDYSVKVMNGRKVVENLNDYLWFSHSTVNGRTKITLTPGFYTGTDLGNELETQLNAAFTGITFTVNYDAPTGLYTITPDAGQIQYLEFNPSKTISERDSIAGHLFGLNATTAYAASVTSDTEVFGLDTEAFIIDETNAELQHYHDTVHELSIDQALHIETNTAALSVTYTVVYERSINGV